MRYVKHNESTQSIRGSYAAGGVPGDDFSLLTRGYWKSLVEERTKEAVVRAEGVEPSRAEPRRIFVPDLTIVQVEQQVIGDGELGAGNRELGLGTGD